MKGRYTAARVIITICAMVIVASLVQLQIVEGRDYRERSDRRTTRSVVLEAPRGEIYDRYGRDIVTNRSGYSVQLCCGRDTDDESLNRLIYNLCYVFERRGQPVSAEPAIVYDGEAFVFAPPAEDFSSAVGDADLPADGGSSDEGPADEGALDEGREWKEAHGFDASASADSIIAELSEKYGLGAYTGENLARLAAVRLDMEERGFSASTPYEFAGDVGIDIVTTIKEQSAAFVGAQIVVQPVRDYAEAGVASHILGRVGTISREEYEEHSGEGYNINSRIGKQGLEKYLEKYLRGEDGLSAAQQTSGGGNIESSIEKPAVNGRSVSLTLDFELQKTAEKVLGENIVKIADEAGSPEGGSDCDSGAVVVLDVNNCDVLAMASYPSYDIEKFSSSYSELLDNPARPLINRALMGTYTPGSTFKPCVAFAALQEGAITVDETIEDTGKYTYYKDYQPGCWLYNQSGETHGAETVSEAIRDSCNVFFFETGRRLGIEKIDEYARAFGFGSKTGIELESEEAAGSVASPSLREQRGQTWFPGDVLQTAIGQSDTLVTPLQLACYTAAIANGGVLYRPHLIKSIQAGGGADEITTRPEEVSRISMSPEAYAAVTDGMRMVVSSGTAREAFSGCKVPVAAKTGSAQISTVYTNGVYIAYAPSDAPQIAVACVLEKSGGGSKAAPIVRAVIEKYFSVDDAADEAAPNTLKP